MLYRENPKNGDMLSSLGFGAMRLPKAEGERKKFDEEKSVALLRKAYEKGVNYFDTAYAYSGGENERVLGIAVKPFRSEIKIATKLPLLQIKKYSDFDRLFETSLERLQTDYIDYYLLHCVLSYSQYRKIVGIGVNEWIKNKKQEGSVKNIGFSFHGPYNDFVKILDDYDWDFCQIQYNYYDVSFQAGRNGLLYAAKKGLPVIIMEPLRGGKLVNDVPKKAEKLFSESFPDRSLAEIGMRFVFSHPEATVTLSGMGNDEMLDGNLKTAEESPAGCLAEEDIAVYDRAREAFFEQNRILCTGCAYCMPCPKGVNIPGCFASYNSIRKGKRIKTITDYVQTCGGLSPSPGFASQCVGCGLCKTKCPQSIEIPEMLKKVRSSLEPPLMKSALKAFKKISFGQD